MKPIYYIIGALILGFIGGYFIAQNGDKKAVNQDIHMHVGDAGIQQKDQIWTCSMHPQIRQNKPGLCPICGMDLIPLEEDMGGNDPSILKMSPEAVKLAQVETMIVGEGNSPGDGAASPIAVDGTIEMDERTINTQVVHLPGRIENIAINFEGEYVSEGQKIATLYSTELMAASQELITASQFDHQMPGIMEAARQKLKNWKISDRTIDGIITSGRPMETIDVFAEHSGYVLKRLKTQGDYLQQGEALYTIGKTNSLWLVFNVFESDIDRVKVGNRVKFTTPATGAKEFFARVTYVNPLLDGKSRTAVVRAEFSNRGHKLKPGMVLSGYIYAKSPMGKGKKAGLSIPSTAILWTGKRSVVYVKVPDMKVPTFEYREVVIGDSGNGQTIVLEGLAPGEEVVVKGAFVIDAAAQLNNKQSMMNKMVSIKNDGNEDLPDFVEVTPGVFKEQLERMTESYIFLKDAMVNADKEKGKKEGEKFLGDLKAVDMTLLKGDAHKEWMKIKKSLESHGQKITKADDIEIQRMEFSSLSDALIRALKIFGTKDKQYYVQHCPMAMENKGADWISMEKKIRNPYFGEKMMTCGKVILDLSN